MTPIKNKAEEIKAWMGRILANDGDYGAIDVVAQINRRWPDLDAEIRQQIFEASVPSEMFVRYMRDTEWK